MMTAVRAGLTTLTCSGLAIGVLALFAPLALVGCGPGTSAGSPSASPPASGGLLVPTEQLPAYIRCLVENGFRLVEVEPPQFEGDSPGYQLETDLRQSDVLAVEEKCQKLAPPRAEKTEAELRVIYERWIAERDCLVELGYQPDSPTSFEKFVSDWRSARGPWMPIEGVDTSAWTSEEYRTAKERCTLEMFDRD